MGRSIINNTLTKEFILSKVSQVTIFSEYFNISKEIIESCINDNILIKSPIRDDAHASCGFQYDVRGKLKCRDFGGYFWGDCFDAAAIVINNIYKLQLNANNKQDFMKILRHITFVFKDIFYGTEKDESVEEQIHVALNSIKREKTVIDLVTREWNNKDINYWKQFGVDIKFLNINFVFPVEQYYINIKVDNKPKYFYDKNDPCYAYFLGKDKNGINNFKLYFPFRGHDGNRFITNCNHMEGIINLNKNDYDVIVITKSSKDRISLSNTLLNMQLLYGELNKSIGVINIPHETYKLREIEFNWLLSKLNNDGFIVSLMDNDRTGKLEAKWLYETYSILPIIIPNDTNCKDFSEFYSKHSQSTIYDILNDLINNFPNYEERPNYKYTWNNKENSSLPY